MTPKEKAEQLYDKFHVWDTMDHSEVKKMTLIAVDEIIASNPKIIIKWAFSGIKEFISISYWQEVKQEIKKL